MLGAEAYSAWRVSRMLTRFEALRVGDDASAFRRAITGCENVRYQGATTICTVSAGPWTARQPWAFFAKNLPPQTYEDFTSVLHHLGIRSWEVTVLADTSNQRIDSLGAGVYVIGRGTKSLLGTWQVANQIPIYLNSPPGSATEMHRAHLTSEPSGNAFFIYLTPQSTQEDLSARRFNLKCLLSFRGCDLCELLPAAVVVAAKRDQHLCGIAQ